MNCSISGKPTNSPVVSIKSGTIYDKKLITSYINSHGKDPINDQPLSLDDLVEVNLQNEVLGSSVSDTSIPSLLSSLQDEWDAVALEIFQLRKQLKESRQELSIALYHHDAAVRVAAKAVKERDEAKRALEELVGSMAKGEINNHLEEAGSDVVKEEEIMATDNTQISAEISQLILDAQGILFKRHQENKFVSNITSETNLKLITLNENQETQLAQLLAKTPGCKNSKISHVSQNPMNNEIFLITFEKNHNCIEYDSEKNTIINKYSFTKKTVGDGNLVSLNWIKDEEEEGYKPILAFSNGVVKIGDHQTINIKNSLTGLLVHPLIPKFFIAINDYNYSIYYQWDLLFQSEQLESQISSFDLHMDGNLLSLGLENGKILLYELSKGLVVSEFNTELDEVINLKFAHNGYWLLASVNSQNSNQKLIVYNLRKSAPYNIVASLDFKDTSLVKIDKSSQLIVLRYNEADDHGLQYLRYFKKTKTWKLIEQDIVKIEDYIVDIFFQQENGINQLVAIDHSNKLHKLEFVAEK
ncbi:hypothetical protein PACTADRAFT_892 [Pachysolen tannophilus NRRL Y-2460]|uniref:Pre-mRNA-processing factor 19 n=1 Tax=Pachysolen tannophilus NRRL Y-2460 TaxID=669874 RepID=A0A1E4U331_PACTA|nr:hypothetical protein PACTADRAFT_892 [Pachysolen tannophilus NRRL Y-2460]